MGDYRYRAKDNYIHEADWQGLYVLTEHWKSDLEFYADDLRFLQHLIDKYFIWMTRKENIDEVRDIESDLVETDRKCNRLMKRIKKHLRHLANLIENPLKYDSQVFRGEHEKLEDEIAVFVKSVRANRKEVFAITEHLMESKVLSRILEG